MVYTCVVDQDIDVIKFGFNSRNALFNVVKVAHIHFTLENPFAIRFAQFFGFIEADVRFVRNSHMRSSLG